MLKRQGLSRDMSLKDILHNISKSDLLRPSSSSKNHNGTNDVKHGSVEMFLHGRRFLYGIRILYNNIKEINITITKL